jgi:exodeoxyribonuclease VII large subunit
MDASSSSKHLDLKDRKVFPLSKLTDSIAVQIDRSFAGAYWITAEISKLNYYPQSGHCYPQLVEKRDGKIVADIRGFILNSRYRELSKRFEQVNGKQPGDGMQILFRCKVGFHAVYGLSLNIIDIEPAYTLGEMARMRNEALALLVKKGILNQNKILGRPLLLRNLAVVSVETSKGWRDFKNILDSSIYGESIKTRLFPALLQGDAAIDSIAKALGQISALGDHFDAVCIIRGGGGETGLDCYDNFGLAEMICKYPLPVLTGIGHATNLTLVEQVAHRNLITPTALAGFVIEGFTAFNERISDASEALRNLQKGMLRNLLNGVDKLNSSLKSSLISRRHEAAAALQKTARTFEIAAKKAVDANASKVQYQLPARLSEASRTYLRSKQQSAVILPSQLTKLCPAYLAVRKQQLSLLSEKTRLLDPAHALKRGYSITTLKGKAITNSDQLNPGDLIETRFATGSSQSTVNPSAS